jgi:adenosine deaminase
MAITDFRSFLKALPKCEHHMHLEGALSPAILFQLAAKNDIILPADDAAFASTEALSKRYNDFSSLDDFLHYYYIGMSVLIDASDFEALAWDYFQHARQDGVMHAELFFDPQAHLERGVTFATVQAGFEAARRRAHSELGISSELICCFLRHLPAAHCEATFAHEELQASLGQGHFIGIGLDSSELAFPPELFKSLYADAKARSLRLTAHAGEEGPAEYIANALEHLEVERIDHGIRLATDAALMSKVAERGIMLTVCPYSNLYLRCVTSIGDLPIRTFLDAGVKFSLNSDDPAYFGNHYILDNYMAVHEAFALSVDEWALVCENGIRGSWCSDSRKGAMLDRLRQTIDHWRNEGDQA